MISICEVGPRDGLQNEKDVLAPKTRAELVNQLAAAGLPVVASAIGGGAELIDNGQSGVLIPPAAIDPLAEAIDSLLADDALRRRMGEAARERIVERYTIEAMTRQTVAVYELAAKRLQKDG